MLRSPRLMTWKCFRARSAKVHACRAFFLFPRISRQIPEKSDMCRFFNRNFENKLENFRKFKILKSDFVKIIRYFIYSLFSIRVLSVDVRSLSSGTNAGPSSASSRTRRRGPRPPGLRTSRTASRSTSKSPTAPRPTASAAGTCSRTRSGRRRRPSPASCGRPGTSSLAAEFGVKIFQLSF